jgi:hypothetical protein
VTDFLNLSLNHVIAGIAGALILALLGLLIRIGMRLGFPVLFRIAFGGGSASHFEGQWTATYKQTDGTENTEKIMLRGAGQLIWGHSTCSWIKNGKKEDVTYSIVGLHGDRTLVATYVADDRRSADRGVFQVSLDRVGAEAKGKISGYQKATSDFVLESNDYLLIRS